MDKRKGVVGSEPLPVNASLPSREPPMQDRAAHRSDREPLRGQTAEPLPCAQARLPEAQRGSRFIKFHESSSANGSLETYSLAPVGGLNACEGGHELTGQKWGRLLAGDRVRGCRSPASLLSLLGVHVCPCLASRLLREQSLGHPTPSWSHAGSSPVPWELPRNARP